MSTYKNTSIALRNYFDQCIHNRISEGRVKNVSEIVRARRRSSEEENKIIQRCMLFKKKCIAEFSTISTQKVVEVFESK